MKYFNQYPFFGLFCLLHVFVSVNTENVYERVSPYLHESDIVDPHSIYYNSQSKTVELPKENLDTNSNEMAIRNTDFHKSYCQDAHYERFSRHLINMLVMKSKFKTNNNGLAIGNLELEATVEELEMLSEFGKGKISVRQIDGIISNVIRPIQISLFDEAVDYTDKIAMYLFQHRIIFGTLLLSIFVFIIALKVKWTRLRIIFLIFDIMITISFMLTWWELLQETEIKLAAQQNVYSKMPDECRQHEMGFSKSLFLFLGFYKDDCLKYFEAVMTDPVLKVTPLHAFSHMATKFFLHPLSMSGHYYAVFIDDISRPLYFPFNITVKLLLILFIPVLIGALLFVALGGSMGVRLGPFLHVYLHGSQSTPPRNSLANSDRQAIEVIQSEFRQVDVIHSTETRPTLSAKKETPQNLEVVTQSDEAKIKQTERQEDSDTNSEEFPEEKEYEKVFKITLESEMHEVDNVEKTDNQSHQKDKEPNSHELGIKIKRSLDLSSGDH